MKTLQELIKEFLITKEDVSFKEIYKEIVNRMKFKEELFFLYSPVTNNLYVEDKKEESIVFVFSKEEYAESNKRRLAGMNILTIIKKVKADEMFDAMYNVYRSGFKFIMIDFVDEQSENNPICLKLSISNFIENVDLEKTSIEKRGIENQELVLAANTFFQNLYVNRETTAMELEMFKHLTKSYFIIPMIIKKNLETKDGLTTTIAIMEDSKEIKYFPVFTDIVEYREWEKRNSESKGFGRYVLSFNKLQTLLKESKTINHLVINPFGFSFKVTQSMLDIIELTVKDITNK